MTERAHDTYPSPVGSITEAIHLRGEELDGSKRWVGADVWVRVRQTGWFSFLVVTKTQYASDQLSQVHLDLANPQELIERNTAETRPPYVINDEEITLDILAAKFVDKLVTEDFASSLWYEGPIEGPIRLDQTG